MDIDPGLVCKFTPSAAFIKSMKENTDVFIQACGSGDLATVTEHYEKLDGYFKNTNLWKGFENAIRNNQLDVVKYLYAQRDQALTNIHCSNLAIKHDKFEIFEYLFEQESDFVLNDLIRIIGFINSVFGMNPHFKYVQFITQLGIAQVNWIHEAFFDSFNKCKYNFELIQFLIGFFEHFDFRQAPPSSVKKQITTDYLCELLNVGISPESCQRLFKTQGKFQLRPDRVWTWHDKINRIESFRDDKVIRVCTVLDTVLANSTMKAYNDANIFNFCIKDYIAYDTPPLRRSQRLSN
jgi:hypothetical protein